MHDNEYIAEQNSYNFILKKLPTKIIRYALD